MSVVFTGTLLNVEAIAPGLSKGDAPAPRLSKGDAPAPGLPNGDTPTLLPAAYALFSAITSLSGLPVFQSI